MTGRRVRPDERDACRVIAARGRAQLRPWPKIPPGLKPCGGCFRFTSAREQVNDRCPRCIRKSQEDTAMTDARAVDRTTPQPNSDPDVSRNFRVSESANGGSIEQPVTVPVRDTGWSSESSESVTVESPEAASHWDARAWRRS